MSMRNRVRPSVSRQHSIPELTRIRNLSANFYSSAQRSGIEITLLVAIPQICALELGLLVSTQPTWRMRSRVPAPTWAPCRTGANSARRSWRGTATAPTSRRPMIYGISIRACRR
jgi:hypothetical protein